MVDEEGSPNSDRSHKSGLVLLHSQKQDGHHELGGEEHLEEEPLRCRYTIAQCGRDGRRAGNDCVDDGGSANPCEELKDDQVRRPYRPQGTRSQKSEGNL